MPNVLAERIEETLRPIIGSVLASVSVDLETKRVGATADTVGREHLPPIADNLVEQLRLVVGRELAEAAASRVRNLG